MGRCHIWHRPARVSLSIVRKPPYSCNNESPKTSHHLTDLDFLHHEKRSLSRSGKQILHVDPNDYYGGPEASLSLQEADTWAEQHASPVPSSSPSSGSAAAVTKQSDLPLSRAYSLALSPQVIHGRSALISQLVSSRAYRQLDFLAVGSFFVFKPSSSEPGGQEAASASPSLQRIPSTREDVFSTTAIPSRSKRSLMKFLKFVLDYDGEQNSETWRPFADKPLAEFLSSEFKLDAELLAYVHTLTLSLQRSITTKEGLAVIHRHLTSMGMFGPGFAAVYPKWGGISEVAQVACRACAVGGAVYMLSTKLNEVHNTEDSDELTLDLSNVHGGDIQVKTRLLVRGGEHISAGDGSERASRLVAVVDSPLELLFEAVVEGAPIPAVAVIAFPTGSPTPEAAEEHPIYVFAHSSQTGECPVGQSESFFYP